MENKTENKLKPGDVGYYQVKRFCKCGNPVIPGLTKASYTKKNGEVSHYGHYKCYACESERGAKRYAARKERMKKILEEPKF
jgi:hypothetical protein